MILYNFNKIYNKIQFFTMSHDIMLLCIDTSIKNFIFIDNLYIGLYIL